MDTFLRFRKLHRLQKSPVEGMKHSEIMILFRIKEHGEHNGVRISEISHRMRVTSPTVTQLVNKLEEDGLVKRTLDPNDRRSIRVTLTPKGEDVIEKSQNTFFERYSSLVDALGTEKSILLADLLSESIDYLSKI
nr:MarR family transcriptional regulator [Alkalibaculum sporogenes]